MTALNFLCWCQYFINHVTKQLQNIYRILLKDPVLQIFKICWISGEFQIQRRACTVGFLIFFLHTDGTMGFPTRLCHSIFFLRNLGIVRELKIDLLFFSTLKDVSFGMILRETSCLSINLGFVYFSGNFKLF